MRIVETDNFGSDYPDERFVNIPSLPRNICEQICNLINNDFGDNYNRFYKTVEEDYKLQPGFEP